MGENLATNLSEKTTTLTRSHHDDLMLNSIAGGGQPCRVFHCNYVGELF